MTGAVVTPISLATTFAQAAVGEHAGFEYARTGNPTRRALEECLASLEGAAHGLAFASGHGRGGRGAPRCSCPATTSSSPTTRTAARTGWCRRCSRRPGSQWSAVDLTDLDRARRRAGATRPASSGSRRRPTRCSRSSTSRRLRAVAHAARRARRGRQHVRHAVPAAAARARRRRRGALEHEVPRRSLRRRRRVRRRPTTPSSATQLAFVQNAVGAVPSPFDCYLVLRGVKTLGGAHGPPLRERRARSSRCWLEHPAVDARAVPGAARRTRPRRRPPPDARLRRHGQLRRRRRRGRRARRGRADPAVHAGRVARRGRVAHRAPGPHDARLGRRVAARRRPRPRAPVGRARDGRRPRRRPAGRARRRFDDG